jgi:hypothetical protein
MLDARAYPQLLNTGRHAGHGLPVIRVKPLLNQVQLMAGEASGILWESSQILLWESSQILSRAYPEELLHGRKRLYNFLYRRKPGVTLANVRPVLLRSSGQTAKRLALRVGGSMQAMGVPWSVITRTHSLADEGAGVFVQFAERYSAHVSPCAVFPSGQQFWRGP